MSEIFQLFIATFQEKPLAQSIGFLAVIINIFAFITTKDKKFLIFMAISSLVWGMHFYLMGLLSAAGVSFFDVIKNLIALRYKRNKRMLMLFFAAYSIIGFFTFDPEHLISLIPIVSPFLSLYFIFYFKGLKLKVGFLVILLFRFSYNLLGHSLGGMLSDSILFISWCYGAYRLLREGKTATAPGE